MKRIKTRPFDCVCVFFQTFDITPRLLIGPDTHYIQTLLKCRCDAFKCSSSSRELIVSILPSDTSYIFKSTGKKKEKKK